MILEKADSVGGTWRENTYPGCACDIPSHLYSFSFAPNPDWTHLYARQPEIRAYLEGIADRYGLREHLQTRVRIQGSAERGRIEIEYFGAEDLDRLAAMLVSDGRTTH